MGICLTQGDSRWRSTAAHMRLWLGPVVAPLLLAIAVACGGGDTAGEARKVLESTTPAAVLTREALRPTGYANPNLLTNPQLLAALLFDKDVRILDARPKEDYDKGHIGQAISLPVELTFAKDGPAQMVASVAELEKLFGEKGVSNNTRVIVYDNGGENKAARLLWTLEYLGHDKVAYLDGGLKNWLAQPFTAVTQPFPPKTATFTAKVNANLLSDKTEITADLGKAGVVFLDARSAAEYKGEDVRAKRGGHIPGAVNIEWTQNFTKGDVPTILPAEDLKKLYEVAKLSSDKLVHVYCQTGQRSSVTYLALRLLGYNVSNYDGSWQEWGNEENTPVEK